ncbi:MAG: formylglycine-generating enzyme family protein, partial [Desulfomonilaceae bacterium]
MKKNFPWDCRPFKSPRYHAGAYCVSRCDRRFFARVPAFLAGLACLWGLTGGAATWAAEQGAAVDSSMRGVPPGARQEIVLGPTTAASAPATMVMAQAAPPQNEDSSRVQAPPNALTPQESLKWAGEFLSQGDAAKASEIIGKAMRDCDKGGDARGECMEWLSALHGIKAALDAYPERKTYTNSIGMTFVRIPAGEFMMGSLKQEMDWLRLTFKKTWRAGHKQWFEDELPLHPVRITRSFYMGVTEVTVGQFRQFVKETQYKTDAEKGDGGMIWSNKEERWVAQKDMKWNSVPWKIAEDQPVVFVSWNDAKAFCRWLSRKEKRVYRLPTEAEWEMACRGGAAWARYPWGNRLPGDSDCNFGDGNPKLPGNLATVDDGYQYVSPVGSYKPNAYGLHDMAGNVMEWVEDYYDRNYFENSPLEDPKGPPKGVSHVNKGGNWFASPADGRCAFRGFSGPEMSFWNLGFRVVLEDKEEQAPVTAKKKDGASSSERAAQDAAFPPSDGDAIILFRQAMYAAQQQQWDAAVEDLERA